MPSEEGTTMPNIPADTDTKRNRPRSSDYWDGWLDGRAAALAEFAEERAHVEVLAAERAHEILQELAVEYGDMARREAAGRHGPAWAGTFDGDDS